MAGPGIVCEIFEFSDVSVLRETPDGEVDSSSTHNSSGNLGAPPFARRGNRSK